MVDQLSPKVPLSALVGSIVTPPAAVDTRADVGVVAATGRGERPLAAHGAGAGALDRPVVGVAETSAGTHRGSSSKPSYPSTSQMIRAPGDSPASKLAGCYA